MLQAAEGPALAAPGVSRLTPPVIAVVGATAAGKTRLALELAKRLGGEVVSADMGQLYRRLDAGTAKPEGSWTARPDGRKVYLVEGVPYHLVDLLDPSQPTDAGSFARSARPILEDIRSRGLRPIVAGGSGLYLRALFEGLDSLPKDEDLRRRLTALAEEKGRPWLHSELARKDPEAARRIPPGNLQRVVRALEIVELTGRPAPARRVLPRDAEEPVYLGVERSKEDLAERILRRAEGMFPAMLAEVSSLVPSVYRGDEPGFRCLGYPQALACLRGELDRESALAEMVRLTNAYAKRQLTWFRRQVPTRWISPRTPVSELAL